MTAITHAPARAGLRDRLAALRARLRDERARRAIFNRTRRELGLMTDRDLADIGVSRLSIDDIAREAAYGRA